jgi:PAS domain S-box-containing protein
MAESLIFRHDTGSPPPSSARQEIPTEVELNSHSNLLKTLLDTVETAVIYADRNGLIQEINACAEKLLGIKRSEVFGLSLFELHPPESARSILKILDKFATDRLCNHQIQDKEFKGRWFNWRITAIRDEEGEMRGIVLALHDITDHRRLSEKHSTLERELQQEQKLSAIGIMASGIAHNLNGPLSVIVGYLDLLYSRHPELQEIPLVLAQSERMKEIISNMMIKSRHEQDTQKRAIDLNLLLKNELKFLEANLEFKNNVKKHYEFARNLPLIQGVYSDFSQALLNVINNAIDAMFEAPVKNLKVNTHFDAQNIYIEITDTGCGLDVNDVEKLFTPFYSTKPAVGDESGRPCGTGLGLSSAYQLITKYNGRIQVEGRSGEGAKFTIILPVESNRISKREEAVQENDSIGKQTGLCDYK